MSDMIISFPWEMDTDKQFLPTKEDFPELSFKLDFSEGYNVFVEGPIIDILTWYAVKWHSRSIENTPRYGCDVIKFWDLLFDQDTEEWNHDLNPPKPQILHSVLPILSC